MAQLVEHILGKDEVPGPNPGSSSRQPRRFTFGALVLYEQICFLRSLLPGTEPGKDTNLLCSFLVLKSPPDSSQSESVSNTSNSEEKSSGLWFFIGFCRLLWEYFSFLGLSGAATSYFGSCSVPSAQNRFAYPECRSASLLARRKEWVSSARNIRRSRRLAAAHVCRSGKCKR